MEVNEDNLVNKPICQTCLCVGRRVYKITNKNLVRFYLDALNEIPVNDTKLLVNIVVCWECVTMLRKCWSFKEQAKDCYKTLAACNLENLNEDFSTISRPPHLQTHNLVSINIKPSKNKYAHEVPIVNIKKEEGNSEGGLSDPLSNHRLSDSHDNSKEMNTELETHTTKRAVKKLRRDLKNKPERTRITGESLDQKKKRNNSDSNKPHPPQQAQDVESITTEIEIPFEIPLIHVKEECDVDLRGGEAGTSNEYNNEGPPDPIVHAGLTDPFDNNEVIIPEFEVPLIPSMQCEDEIRTQYVLQEGNESFRIMDPTKDHVCVPTKAKRSRKNLEQSTSEDGYSCAGCDNLFKLKKVPKTSAERARAFRARRALRKLQSKLDATIAAENIRNAGSSEDHQVPGPSEIRTIENIRKLQFKLDATIAAENIPSAGSSEDHQVPGPSEIRTIENIAKGGSEPKKAKSAAQRMREYRARKKLKNLSLLYHRAETLYKNVRFHPH